MGTVLNETMPFALVSLSTEGKIKTQSSPLHFRQ